MIIRRLTSIHAWSLAFIVALFLPRSGSAQDNPIQAENAKPGTMEWRLTDPAANHEIEGYASLTSVARGATIRLYVSTVDPSYSIAVYRMGWYSGQGARLMLDGITRPGILQIMPTPDPVTGRVECDWRDPYSLSIPASADPTDWASGIYLAKLTTSLSGKQSYIIFVVRNDERCSDYLFQSSVTTYQAYNQWGGASLYGFDGAAFAPHVSFNRPYGLWIYPNAESGVGAGEFLTNEQPNGPGWPPLPHPAAWEYNMVRFLEREGYDVTYCTNVDTHAEPDLLLPHKGFLSVGHDEYWSWEMRTNVESARDAGINLAFFSANTCHWQIRFEPSPVTGEPDRTIVCYKSETGDPLGVDGDPANDHLVTTHWRDPPVNLPEDALLGVMFGFWPVDVDLVIHDADHWVCAGTGLTNGDILPGLVGYEADGLFNDAPPGVELVAHSPAPYPNLGAGTHSDMTVYTNSRNAIVFASGSIQWAWGLDDFGADASVGPTLRTSRLSAAALQMTRNVLARFTDHVDPTIECPGDIVTQTDPGECSAVTALSVTAADNLCGTPNVVCNPPSGAAFLLGTTNVECTATDAVGNTTICNFDVTVQDLEAPVVRCGVSQVILWPPNHSLVNPGFTVTVTDNCISSIGVQVFADEDDEAQTGDGTFSPDAKDLAADRLRLRAERVAPNDGRVYLIVVTASDQSSNEDIACCTVVVPRSMSVASLALVGSHAAAARQYCLAHGGMPPPGFTPVGDGPVLGPHH